MNQTAQKVVRCPMKECRQTMGVDYFIEKAKISDTINNHALNKQILSRLRKDHKRGVHYSENEREN